MSAEDYILLEQWEALQGRIDAMTPEQRVARLVELRAPTASFLIGPLEAVEMFVLLMPQPISVFEEAAAAILVAAENGELTRVRLH